MASRPANSLLEAADLGLFFLYIGLNLAWVCLRSLSIAVDEYVFYEKLELVRRVGNVATILAMLIGLPFTVFLVGSNLLWAVLVTSAVAKLLSRGAMAPQLRGFARELMAFFQTNMRSIARSGTFALSDIFIYTFPYYVVPWAFGLGAPIIILEATFRIFRGASVIYTRGLRSRDPRTDPRARGARRAKADPYDADRGGAVLPAGRFRLRIADLRVEAIVRVPARIGGDRAADGHAHSGGDAVGQPRANGRAIAIAACRLLPRDIAHLCRRCGRHGGRNRDRGRCQTDALSSFSAFMPRSIPRARSIWPSPLIADQFSPPHRPHGAAKWKRAAEPAAAR